MIYTIMKKPALINMLREGQRFGYTEKEDSSPESITNKIVICINPTLAMINPEYFKLSFDLSKFIDLDIYTVIIKAVFFDGTGKMIAHQFTYKFKLEDFNTRLFKNLDFNDSKPMDLPQLYGKFWITINEMNEDYSIEDIDYVNIIFYHIFIPEKKVLLNINKLNLNKEFVSIKKNRKQFSKNFLPLTLNENKYGERRKFSTSNYKSIPELSNVRIFENDKNKIIIYDITPNSTKKEIYDLNDKLIQTVFDEKINNNTFTRLIDNLKLTIQNEDKIIKSEASIKLKTIKPLKKSTKSTFNRNLGSFDLETYLNTNKKNYNDKNTTKGTYEVYALGFSVVNNNIHEPLTKMYY